MAKVKFNNGVNEISGREFEETISKPLVLIDFFAEWCMPCVMMAPVIEEIAEKFKGKIEFAKVNIDDNSSLAQKFKVISIPTLIVFKKGKEIERIVGAREEEQLEERLRKLAK